MNYKRIYDQFISDRATTPPAAGEYSELHHIVPRSVGGNDEKENLIRLSASDHFFAHLLLAKIYGGKMWVALYAMAYLCNDKTERNRFYFRKRLKFAFVRKNLANAYRKILSGPNGKIADKTKYTLHHIDGRQVTGNRFELEASTSVPRQQISALLRGAKKTAHGWCFLPHNPNKSTKEQRSSQALMDKTVMTLHHYDGRTWVGTKIDFKNHFGKKFYIQTDGGHCQGWYKNKDDARLHEQKIRKKAALNSAKRGDISGANNPNSDSTVYRWLNLKTGKHFFATKYEVKTKMGVTPAGVSALFSGKQKQTADIALASTLSLQNKAVA